MSRRDRQAPVKDDDEPLLTAVDVAKLLSVTPDAVRAMVRRKQIPHVRLGERRIRFHRAEVNEFVSSRHVGAVQ